MTTARDVILAKLSKFDVFDTKDDVATGIMLALLSAPDSVRQELAALLKDGMVCIPRAQHEALMAAAKELINQHRDYYGKSDGNCRACKAIAALHAAGIQIEDEPHPSSLMGHVERKP
jgi:hypothetical protein